MHTEDLEKIPKITVGLPVFNGEKFLSSRIKSILKQSYKNFILVISDNGSTDKTQIICEQFLNEDPRIEYFRQEKNMGAILNYNFLAEKSKTKYFVWATADDSWENKFLEKTLAILENNNNFVACTVISQSPPHSKSDYIDNYSETRKKLRNFIISKRPNVFPITGKFENKVRKILKGRPSDILYGLIRSEILKKSLPYDTFVGVEFGYILNISKFGDIYEINEPLLLRTESGLAWHGILRVAKVFNTSKIGRIFPDYHFIKWCLKNLESKIIIKNFDMFFQIIFETQCAVLFETTLELINKIKRKKSGREQDA